MLALSVGAWLTLQYGPRAVLLLSSGLCLIGLLLALGLVLAGIAYALIHAVIWFGA